MIHRAVWSGEFHLCGVLMKCHVLDTGERIIEPDSVDAFFQVMEHQAIDPDYLQAEVQRFEQWLQCGGTA